MIFGERIRQARELLGETQKDFGEQVGLTQWRLSKAESSVAKLDEETVATIAEHCGFPPVFFERPPVRLVGEYQFRARLRFKAADRNRAVRCAEIIHESYAQMRREITPVPVRLPVLPGSDPLKAASHVRASMGIDHRAPIPNLTLPVERLGVAVLALPIASKKHDAFCWWQDEGENSYPVMCVLSGSPGDRLRWSMAHELGHLILHRHGEGSQEHEKDADRFAAELLTPLDSLRTEMPDRPKLTSLYAMKARWGVSVQSLIRRARELGVLDDHQYTSLFRQISARGERMRERYQIPREKPRAYRKMTEVLFDEPIEGLSALAGWTPSFTADVLEGFAASWELPRKQTVLTTSERLAEVVPLAPRRK